MMVSMSTRWQDAGLPRGATYDERWATLAASGASVHGEADLVDELLRRTDGARVLDAGCGTGRVAIELARRGHSVVGVDADAGMLDAAKAKDPALTWLLADLTDVGACVEEVFDVVLLAGNVMIFLAPGTEGRVLGALADRLSPTGLLVAGFSIRPRRLPLEEYDRLAAAAGLELENRWATWGCAPYAGGDYAVSVHRRTAVARSPA
jgi:SAM-dependent methyltransferase